MSIEFLRFVAHKLRYGNTKYNVVTLLLKCPIYYVFNNVNKCVLPDFWYDFPGYSSNCYWITVFLAFSGRV